MQNRIRKLAAAVAIAALAIGATAGDALAQRHADGKRHTKRHTLVAKRHTELAKAAPTARH